MSGSHTIHTDQHYLSQEHECASFWKHASVVMSRVCLPELSFVEWQQCTCKISIDTIHKTLTLHRFVLMTLGHSSTEGGVWNRGSIELFRQRGDSEFMAWDPLCEKWAYRRGYQMVIRREKWCVPSLSPMESTSAVSFVIAAEQGKQYVSTRTSRSVSWNSLCWSCFLYPKLGGIKW